MPEGTRAAEAAGGGGAFRTELRQSSDDAAVALAGASRQHARAALAALQRPDAAAAGAALAEALAELSEAVRCQVAFLHAAAHDLRNPLAAIRGQAQLMRGRLRRLDVPEPEAARLADGLTGLEAAVERMADLIDRLLDASWTDDEPA